ncbi:MAG TPA: LysR family transcriptional regulator [Bradyrhizobium sp.]|jgi:DNA-binding transcriptional LysR family regulator
MKSPKRKIRLLSRLRPSQLELLAAIERSDTLSAAAREVNLTQPAASRLLRNLASDLDIDLFERVGRTLKPTAAGRTLVRRAAALIAEIDRTQQELEAIDGGLAGTASIGTGVSSCYVIVPRALKLLLTDAPQINVFVREGPMDELLARLHAGQIDILVGRFSSHVQNPEISTQELYSPAVRAVCGPAHPLARKRAVGWNDLMDYPWILPENGTAMRGAAEELFRKQRRKPERCLVESSSIQANVALMNGSHLIWMLSADVADYFFKLGLLRIPNVPSLPAPGAFVMAHLRRRSLSPAAQRLAACLVKAARI